MAWGLVNSVIYCLLGHPKLRIEKMKKKKVPRGSGENHVVQ